MTTAREAFRDGAVEGEDGEGRRRAGLVTLARDETRTTHATREGEDGGRRATYGCVGTLCQWIEREDVVEFYAINIVWCEFPEDFDATRARDGTEVMGLFPPVALDDDFAPSGVKVYTLGVHEMWDNRARESRRLMGKILDFLSESARECADAVAWKEAPWRQVVEETLPIGARHPSEFSFWCLHAIPSIALDNDFRWLILSTDDAYSRLSLILSRLRLEVVAPANHVPVTHRCGFVLTMTRMMRQLSNIDARHGGCAESNDVVPTAVRSKIFFNPGGWYDRYAVFARDPVDLNGIENQSLRDLWSRSPYDLLDRTTDVILATQEPSPEFSWFEGYAWLPIACPGCGEQCGFEFSPHFGRDSPAWSGKDWPQDGAPPPGVAFFALTGVDEIWGGHCDDEGSAPRASGAIPVDGDTARDSFR
jgi:hypothetical protein